MSRVISRLAMDPAATLPVSHAPILFKDNVAGELHARLATLGVDARLARRLQAAIVGRGAAAVPDTLPEVSPRLLARVRQAVQVPCLTLVEKAVSPQDGFAKYLF